MTCLSKLESSGDESNASLKLKRDQRKGNRRKGAMLYLILIMMIGFMIAVAFSVDIAHMHLARTELRSATDAAAKAAAIELSITLDPDLAVTRGQEIAAANTVNGEPLQVRADEFVFGRSRELNSGKFDFTVGGVPSNSVQVDGKRTSGSLSGPVPLFFGNIFGVNAFEPETTATATYIERDIVLVVDRSGSMQGQKFADLVTAIDVFVATLDGTPVEEQVGLASYNDFATEDVELTGDLTEITDGMRALPVGGFTSISRGMAAGAAIMDRSRNPDFVERTLIVMTDGNHNRGPEPSTVATTLAADGVVIHTITFGRDADKRRMRDVATIGGGRTFHADDGADLIEIYREIALTLSTMMTQ
ncbi:von Willebrand factor type A domain protein [Rubripirellula amarantea]|uniref:von Willebrand factor type A domain protein n=1 Tax=Rubripirellula amarantea TaxID=2527999 RepID=A0A5C5WW13_9BACT|nr:VWA domain-containing protein [Rubripirellula amarantea]TWT55144.1 von Willebrand factor type A domain protein [Rubripirellula amarantea]